MEFFLNSFYADPFFYITALFALLGGIAALTFFRGVLAGLPHLFTLSAHDEHIDHHRYHAIYGLMLLVFLYIVWEVVRAIGNFFT